MHHPAEEDGQQGEQDAHTDDLNQGKDTQVGDALQRERGGRHIKGLSHPQPHDGRQDAGHHGGVIEHTHAGDLHSEHGRRQGRTEQRGKGGRHAAHGDDPAVLVVQAHPLPDFGGDGTADLENGSLPSRGAAQQVGDDGREEDQRRGAQPQRPVLPHRHQHKVGATVTRHTAYPVELHNGHAAQGQQENQQRPGMAQVGYCGKSIIKGGGHPAAHQAADGGKDQPLDKHQGMFPPGTNAGRPLLYQFHFFSSSPVTLRLLYHGYQVFSLCLWIFFNSVLY